MSLSTSANWLTRSFFPFKDDGIGFDANGGAFATRLGLRGMKERSIALGGMIEIAFAPTQEAEIRAYLPNELRAG